MKEKIKNLADAIFPEVLRFRHHIHAHPELSFEETETAEYISNELDKKRIEHRQGFAGGTGIIAEIGQGKPVVALRADIDALPIEEANEVSYKSTRPGIMHACGHDVHTSSLLGTGLILKELEDEMDFTARLIFQPGEEKLPGGAKLMIEDGALDGVDLMFGQHVHPALPVGKFGFCPEYFMASADELFIDIIGKGGHAARPQELIDPILVAAEIIKGLQSIVSRSADPHVASVLSIGKIDSVGGATNIIPDIVRLQGTFRTFDETWRAEAHKRITRRVEYLAHSHGAKGKVRIVKGFPSLYNEPKLTAMAKDSLESYIGSQNVVQLPPRMTSEDFSYYSRVVPCCFYRLGTSTPGEEEIRKVHTPTFDINEDALRLSCGMMAWLAWSAGNHN